MEYAKEIANKLNDLLEKNFDTEKAYRSASEDVKSPQLKEFLASKAQQRYDFGHELKSEIRNFEETPEEGSSVKGDAMRTWMDLKTNLSSNKEEAVLEEIKRGEKAATEEYNKIIENTNFPPSTENILLKQRKAFEKTLEEVNGLESSFAK